MKKITCLTLVLFCWLAKSPGQMKVVPQLSTQAFIVQSVYNHPQKILAIAEYRVNRLVFLDAVSKLRITELPTEGAVISLATDSAGKFFVAATDRGILHFIDAQSLTISRNLNANALFSNGYYIILEQFPLLFTREQLYFTGFVDPAEKNLNGDFIKASRPEPSDYYIYRYTPATNELRICGKSSRNNPYQFFWDKKQQGLLLLAEKRMIRISLSAGKMTDSTELTGKIKLNNFGRPLFFTDDLAHDRIGIIEDGNYRLDIYNVQTLERTDSLEKVYRCFNLQNGSYLFQSQADRNFYTYTLSSKEVKPVLTDSLEYRPWCYAFHDFRQSLIGLVNIAGLGTLDLSTGTAEINRNNSSTPWGLCASTRNRFFYATNNELYEFDLAGIAVKRRVAAMKDNIIQTVYVPGKTPLLILETAGFDERAEINRSLTSALDYETGKLIWEYENGNRRLEDLRISDDQQKILLLKGNNELTELEVSTGREIRKQQPVQRLYAADFKNGWEYAALSKTGNGYDILSIAPNNSTYSIRFLETHYPVRVFELDHTRNYAALAYPEDDRFYIIPLNRNEPFRVVEHNARVLAFSRDNKWLARGSFNGGYISIFRFPGLEEWAEIKCGVGKVFDLCFSDDGQFLLGTLEDGHISVINVRQKKWVGNLLVNRENFLLKDSLGFYTASKNQVNEIGIRTTNRCYPISNADIKYNRPDLLMESMGLTDSSLLTAYHKAYLKRLKKLNLEPGQIAQLQGFPEALIRDAQNIPARTAGQTIRLPVSFRAVGEGLSRYTIYVNNVPIWGAAGREISRQKQKNFDTVITVSLQAGLNVIEAECSNTAGIRSLREQVRITSTTAASPRFYFIGIGINRFSNPQYDLSWSVKDIRDLAIAFKKKEGANCIIDTLFDKAVTRESILALKQKLKSTGVNDKVVLAYSGHGLLNRDFDYFLSTYTVNFDQPEKGGLPYEELENLLDNIPARRKLLLIDACHSGEVDKEEMVRITGAEDTLSRQGIKGGVPVYTGKTTLGMKNSFELMQSLFVNAGRNTGATIISAAAGTQFAQERGDLKNGVFTYSILEAMEKYPSIKISELKKIVGERVMQLTNGLQQPTSRNETISMDWSLW